MYHPGWIPTSDKPGALFYWPSADCESTASAVRSDLAGTGTDLRLGTCSRCRRVSLLVGRERAGTNGTNVLELALDVLSRVPIRKVHIPSRHRELVVLRRPVSIRLRRREHRIGNAGRRCAG